METILRHISKYCWYIIILLIVIFIYRKPHAEDYLYNVRAFSTRLAVADSSVQLIELKVYNNTDDGRDYRLSDVDYTIYTSENGTGEVGFKDSWREDALYTNLAYYSFSEQKAYVAFIPQNFLDSLKNIINSKRIKDRYFKVYYNVYSNGLINFEVEERSKKDNEEYNIFTVSYQAKEFETTSTELSVIQERIPIPLEQWSELTNTKYNWGISVETPKNRYLDKIRITSYTDDHYSYRKKGGGSNYTYNLKVLPRYVDIWTELKDGKKVGFDKLKFDFYEIKKIFDEIYKGKNSNDRSTITINLDRNGQITDSITLSLDNKKVVLPYIDN